MTAYTDVGKLELQLSWEISRYDQVIPYPGKFLEVMPSEDDECGRVQLKEVEPWQKYSAVHLYGMFSASIFSLSNLKFQWHGHFLIFYR